MYFKNYIYSDYPVDNQYQGFFTTDAHANLGRAVSFVDITSQIGKAVFGTTASAVISVGRIVGGGGSLLISIPSAIAWGVATKMNFECKDSFRKKTFQFIHFGVENFSRGIFTACVGIPLSLIWRVFMVVADIIGIFLPEVGRWARNLNKILNAAMANMIPAEKIAKKRKTRAASQPHHTYVPQGDVMGGLTTQKALEVLGLKEGVSLKNAKKAAHKLYRIYHPDKGGDPEEFKKIRGAYEYLKDEFLCEPSPSAWKDGTRFRQAQPN